MGGMHGFGPVERESDEPLFHAPWERRVFALSFCATPAIGGNTDEFRFAIERIPGPDYLNSSYYERWLCMLEMLAVEKGTVTEAELEGGRSETGRIGEPVVQARDVPRIIGRSSSTRGSDDRPGRFAVGERVRARNLQPWGHTRLPRYARGKVGEVVKDYGVFTFPDRNALAEGEDPQHCYAVTFTGRELWGPDGHENDRVSVDLWESYLEATR